LHQSLPSRPKIIPQLAGAQGEAPKAPRMIGVRNGMGRGYVGASRESKTQVFRWKFDAVSSGDINISGFSGYIQAAECGKK